MPVCSRATINRMSAPDPLRYHGDSAARGARIDFAVNVRGSAPEWLTAGLRNAVDELATYPDPGLDREVREELGARHGRPADEVLLLNGVAEGFTLLPHLCSSATVICPQFTEPEAAFIAAGVPVHRAICPEPWDLPAQAPKTDVAVVGNPTNPTSRVHSRREILSLAEKCRFLVVDEAFMDVIHPLDFPGGENPSVAPVRDDQLIVFRSLTKTWALAGLRCGYALGAADVLADMAARRPAWPLGTLQLRAMQLVAEHGELGPLQEEIRSERQQMAGLLTDAGWTVAPGAAPFLLARPPVAEVDTARRDLAARGIAIRRCDTFPGLDPTWWRLAVRGADEVGTLVSELRRIK